MSGGLTRLVLRAQGQLPVAEPSLPSRFAPIAAPAAAMDPLEDTVPTDVAHAFDDARDAAPTSAVPMRAPVRIDPVPAIPRDNTALPPVGTRPHVRREAADANPVAPATRSPREMHRPAAVADAVSDRIASQPAAAPPMPAQQASGSREPAPDHTAAMPHVPRNGEAHGVTQMTAVSARPTVSGQRAPARAPDVHISIGRLEVHAAPARAAATRAAPVRRPTLSLAEYLAQRK